MLLSKTFAQMLPLESRRLLAAAFPTSYEQYLVELMNRGRANPAAEAARYGVALNEGVPSGETISTAAKQPLAINPYITDAARKHSQWMIDNDIFAHEGVGGSNPKARMQSAGYVFNGTWTWGENIAYRGTGTSSVTTVTAEIERDLFIDAGIDGRGHRVNLMNPDFREVGAGVVTGNFSGYNAVMATQDFGTTGSSVFLTGVAYSDGVSNDSFYTPGEGLGGVIVKAMRVSDSASYQASTWDSGGYSLAVPAGTYTVTASGGGLGGNVTYNNVIVGSQNVKRDFTPGQSDPFASITGGKLTVQGTLGSDSIAITLAGNAYTITRNLTSTTLSANGVTSIDVYAQDGDDGITIGAGVILGAYIDAGAGADFIQGGVGPDTITSGAGKDRAFGGLGDDRVAGNGGHDKVNGEAGKDRLYGGEGNDTLDGGSSTDRMWGENGNNTYYGQGGNDFMYARNTLADVLYGQAGTDHAQIDSSDSVTTIEDLLP
jgi:Ca2+-binding RTX toxin-like protein